MKRKESSKTQPAPKVFDVSRPGRMAASATSRPVIVGHKPQVKDPMMSKDEERSLMDSKRKVNVQPTSAPAIQDAVTSEEPRKAPVASPEPVQQADEQTSAPIVPNAVKDDEYPTDGLASIATSSAVDAGDKPDAEPTYKSPEADTPAEPDAAAAFPAAELDDIAEAAKTDTVPAVPQEESSRESVKTVDTQPTTPTKSSGVVFEDTPTSPQPVKPDPNAEPLPVLHEDDHMQEMIVSHHTEKSSAGAIWIILALVLMGIIIFDVLLDAGIFVIDAIPHTDFF